MYPEPENRLYKIQIEFNYRAIIKVHKYVRIWKDLTMENQLPVLIKGWRE